jgi:NAD(P)-dependent dehydrogenase (short-subunit alcohol dehydrogenase family)
MRIQMNSGEKRLSGRVAIVTGAGQGLGATFARALAAEGAKVVVGDIISTDATCEAVKSSGGVAIGVHADVTDASSVARLINTAKAEYGSLDIVVNNAALSGQVEMTRLTEISTADWDRVMAVNTRGVFEVIKAAVPIMRDQRRGSIINISSGTAIKGSPGLLHYVASKGAVISITRAAARELGEYGIRVNCIAPGLTMSDGVRNNKSWDDAARAANVASRSLKRDAEPVDLVGAVIFLASSDSAFVTGQTLAVDGGSVML